MTSTAIRTIKWSVDHFHSEVTFKVRHLTIANIGGAFKIFDASIYTTDKDFSTVKIDFWIDASSITTGDVKRDEHLKSKDFFDTKNYKRITFFSGSIKKSDKHKTYELSGELTIKGISKNIKLNVQFGGIVNDPWGIEKAGFTIKGKINRTDWGMPWNSLMEAGGVLIGEDIILSCDIEVVNLGKKDLIMEFTDSKIMKYVNY